MGAQTPQLWEVPNTPGAPRPNSDDGALPQQQERDGGGGGGGGDGDGDGDGVAARRTPSSSSQGSERCNHDAWRWRFSAKWQQEQRRALDPPPAPHRSASSELDAMDYVKACGDGVVNLQVTSAGNAARSSRIAARGTAAGAHAANGLSLALEASPSASTVQFEVDPSYASAGLLAEDSASLGASYATPGGSGLREAAAAAAAPRAPPWPSQPPSATNAVLHVAVRARELLQKQREIERDASAAWERSRGGGEAWAGALLAPVAIDGHGRFLYVVLRVRDPGSARQRLLVRGRAGAAAEALAAEAEAEVAAACAANGLPQSPVELVGAGCMEWREDTGRHLHLSAAPGPAGALLPGRQVNGGSPTKVQFPG
jgi:hypothetical protein